ncbi:MAG TPA: hypothetical protein VJY33_24890 [Isosphaeraceae bacterium]|nr:hypothetical protein [Isosphaeraceae bacterium]
MISVSRALVSAMVCLWLGGCSSGPNIVTAKLAPSHDNLMKIGAAYVRFNTENARPPTRAEDLHLILQELGGSLDTILTSPNDGQPYVICWGVDLLQPPTWAKSTPVLAYESEGKNGTRYVLTTLRSVVKMTKPDFEQASFPPGHQQVRSSP